jgi:hypothetical protein
MIVAVPSGLEDSKAVTRRFDIQRHSFVRKRIRDAHDRHFVWAREWRGPLEAAICLRAGKRRELGRQLP